MKVQFGDTPTTIRDILNNEHSRVATDKVLGYIKSYPDKIGELMACFFDDNPRICQRAAWPVGDLGEKYPELLIPYLTKMIVNIKEPKHDAVIRNTIRTWQYMSIPEDYLGEIFELCFNYITDPKFPIAIRAFSMTVCANICKVVPELKEELILAIEEQLEHGSAGIKSRGTNVIKLLSS